MPPKRKTQDKFKTATEVTPEILELFSEEGNCEVITGFNMTFYFYHNKI